MAKRIQLPRTIEDLLPTKTALAALKASPPVTVPLRSRLYRAAWNSDSVLPKAVNSFYRFGPPLPLLTGAGPVPYWWLYLADVAMTAIYEAQFCGHNLQEKGHFHIVKKAETQGVVATLDFPVDLKLLDLTGDTSFQMGIFDRITSDDHTWCQWFAYQLVKARFFEGRAAFDGMLYPSRKNRGKNAIALHAGFVAKVRSEVQVSTSPFRQTPEYRALAGSPLRLPGPDQY